MATVALLLYLALMAFAIERAKASKGGEDAAELAADSTANWDDWNVIESAMPMESNPPWSQIVSFLAGDE